MNWRSHLDGVAYSIATPLISYQRKGGQTPITKTGKSRAVIQSPSRSHQEHITDYEYEHTNRRCVLRSMIVLVYVLVKAMKGDSSIVVIMLHLRSGWFKNWEDTSVHIVNKRVSNVWAEKVFAHDRFVAAYFVLLGFAWENNDIWIIKEQGIVMSNRNKDEIIII